MKSIGIAGSSYSTVVQSRLSRWIGGPTAGRYGLISEDERAFLREAHANGILRRTIIAIVVTALCCFEYKRYASQARPPQNAPPYLNLPVVNGLYIATIVLLSILTFIEACALLDYTWRKHIHPWLLKRGSMRRVPWTHETDGHDHGPRGPGLEQARSTADPWADQDPMVALRPAWLYETPLIDFVWCFCLLFYAVSYYVPLMYICNLGPPWAPGLRQCTGGKQGFLLAAPMLVTTGAAAALPLVSTQVILNAVTIMCMYGLVMGLWWGIPGTNNITLLNAAGVPTRQTQINVARGLYLVCNFLIVLALATIFPHSLRANHRLRLQSDQRLQQYREAVRQREIEARAGLQTQQAKARAETAAAVANALLAYTFHTLRNPMHTIAAGLDEWSDSLTKQPPGLGLQQPPVGPTPTGGPPPWRHADTGSVSLSPRGTAPLLAVPGEAGRAAIPPPATTGIPTTTGLSSATAPAAKLQTAGSRGPPTIDQPPLVAGVSAPRLLGPAVALVPEPELSIVRAAAREIVHRIQQAGKHAALLSGAVVHQPRPINLRSFISSNLRAAAQRSGLKMASRLDVGIDGHMATQPGSEILQRLEPEPQPVPLTGTYLLDPVLLDEVLQHALDNAVEAVQRVGLAAQAPSEQTAAAAATAQPANGNHVLPPELASALVSAGLPPVPVWVTVGRTMAEWPMNKPEPLPGQTDLTTHVPSAAPSLTPVLRIEVCNIGAGLPHGRPVRSLFEPFGLALGTLPGHTAGESSCSSATGEQRAGAGGDTSRGTMHALQQGAVPIPSQQTGSIVDVTGDTPQPAAEPAPTAPHVVIPVPAAAALPAMRTRRPISPMTRARLRLARTVSSAAHGGRAGAMLGPTAKAQLLRSQTRSIGLGFSIIKRTVEVMGGRVGLYDDDEVQLPVLSLVPDYDDEVVDGPENSPASPRQMIDLRLTRLWVELPLIPVTPPITAVQPSQQSPLLAGASHWQEVVPQPPRAGPAEVVDAEGPFMAHTRVSKREVQAYGSPGAGTGSETPASALWPAMSPVRRSPSAASRPGQAASPLAAADTGQPQATRALEGLRLLVVDDETTVRRATERMLLRAGAEVDVAGDGDEALEAVEAAHASGRPYHAVFLDIIMRRVNGDTACQAIRAAGYDEDHLPIIAATGNTGIEDVADYLAGGFNAVLPKPFGLQQVIHQLQSLGLTGGEQS